MSHPIQIRPIAANETWPLRSAVLRPGYPLSEAIFVGDDDMDTMHFGAFVDGQLSGVASLYRETPPSQIDEWMGEIGIADGPIRSWRLRGMAVDPDFQRLGYGRRLLEACLNHVAQQKGRLLWCNARTNAVAFYQASGFQTRGGEFIIPDVGPHWVMSYILEP